MLNIHGERKQAWELTRSTDPNLGDRTIVEIICGRQIPNMTPIPNAILRIQKSHGIRDQIPAPDGISIEEGYSFRIFVCDRQRMMAAVVGPTHHDWFVENDIKKGDYLLLKEYEVDCAEKLDGSGHTIFLRLLDFERWTPPIG